MLAKPHLSISVFTHSDHVLRGLPFFLVPASWKFVIDLTQGVANCTWPYHLSHWQWRNDVMSSMPSFSSSEAKGASSVFGATDPTNHSMVIAVEASHFGFLWSSFLFFLWYLLWNCPQMNVMWPHWWLVNIESDNGLVPSDLYHHMALLGQNGLILLKFTAIFVLPSNQKQR